KLDISGILITRYDPRTVNSREVMARVVERFGDLVFDTVITRTASMAVWAQQEVPAATPTCSVLAARAGRAVWGQPGQTASTPHPPAPLMPAVPAPTRRWAATP
ncbi:ParA family protein, partial [Mycobacterium tuberculosis]|uniref:ParA family protein n=1 Tax=Mycobacterium tuberculosis TaxID=1773 RepID=UPI003C6DE710